VKAHPRLLLNSRNRDGWMEYNRVLGEYAGELAVSSGCGIMSYAHIATSAFLKAKTATKILVQMQPHPASVRNAFLSDQLFPDLQELSNMNELRWPEPVFDTLCREPLLADRCIVASNYTRRTLIKSGVNPNLIAVVPYGVDIDFFTPSIPENGAFKVLFVGQPLRQKGLHYLLEAWTRLNFPKAELRVVARSDRDNAILSRYAGRFTFVGVLDWSRLREEYRRADLLCLPSLSEGFGLVTLESLACGTPVLASDAAGSSELLRDGEDGFVVSAANLASLMDALESAYSDRRRLREMRIAARRKAENFPWSRFRQSVRDALESSQTLVSR
jgi:glycosyltransferase involved in cell wall biosynthesis